MFKKAAIKVINKIFKQEFKDFDDFNFYLNHETPLFFWKPWAAYFKNRFVYKTHLLTNPLLKKGAYYAVDDRIFHCVFGALVEFVEKELACLSTEYSPLNRKNPSLGRDFLVCDTALIYDESMGYTKEDPLYGTKTSQATAAQEILELYDWYKETYPLCDNYIVSPFKEQEMLEKLIRRRGYLWT